MAPPDVARLPHLQSQLLPAPPKSSWNETDNHEDEDSWEVRAFAEDTASAMGTTWPPRSYTCTFCRREFRSAQALGGHMNVHRRDRARLHQSQNNLSNTNNPNHSAINRPSTLMTSGGGGSTLLIPTQEFLVNGGLCLLYQLHNNSHSSSTDQPSTLLSISPYTTSSKTSTPSFIATHPSSQYHASTHRSYYNNKSQPSPTFNQISSRSRTTTTASEGGAKDPYKMGELDLELRLGHGLASR